MPTNYRNYIGTEHHYDIGAMLQFNLATMLGLRGHHKFLDIGCGSLRLGRLLIPYLDRGNYYGIEPNYWQVEKGIENEVGRDLVEIKKPSFSQDDAFTLTTFNTKFDFVWAFGIFTHAHQKEIIRCLDEFTECSHDDTLLVANFVVGENNSDRDKWSYPGFAPYRIDFFEKLAKERNLNFQLINYPQFIKSKKWFILSKKNSKSIIEKIGEESNFYEGFRKQIL